MCIMHALPQICLYILSDISVFQGEPYLTIRGEKTTNLLHSMSGHVGGWCCNDGEVGLSG